MKPGEVTLDQLLTYEELCTLETALYRYEFMPSERDVILQLRKKLRIARTKAKYARPSGSPAD